MKRIAVIMLLFMFLVACAPAQQPVSAPDVKPVEKVLFGVMLPLSGDAASVGEPLLRQLNLAVDEINAAGGIGGKQIELKVEDSKCNPKDGATAAQKLVEVDNVKVIFGGACSGETLGAAPITEAAKVILMSPSATSPKVTAAGDFVFRTAPSDAKGGEIAAEFAISNGYDAAAIISENTDYSQGLRDVFAQSFGARNGTIVANEAWNTGDSDFKTQIVKVTREKPDVVYVVPNAPTAGVQIIKQLRELGFKGQILTGEVLLGRDLVKEQPDVLEGMIGVELAFDSKNPLAAAALSAYEAKHGAPPYPSYQAATRDAVYLIAAAVGKHGLDTEKIRDELYAVKDYDGAVGKLTLDQNGDPLLGYSIKRVENGALVALS